MTEGMEFSIVGEKERGFSCPWDFEIEMKQKMIN